MRDRAGIGQSGLDRLGLHRQRAVGGEPVAPILIARLQRLFDQQPAKAGAIDEQIAFDPATIGQIERFDKARFGMLVDLPDLALDAGNAARFAELAQEERVARGIEMIGIVDLGVGPGGEAASLGCGQLETIVAQRAARALGARAQPHMLEIAHPDRLADAPEGMNVAIPAPRPVFKGNAEFEGRLRRAHKIALVDFEEAVEGADRRDRRLADADGADLVGFDQHDVEQGPEMLRQCRRGDPARRAAARDHHALDRLCIGAGRGGGHRFNLCSKCARKRRAVRSSSGASGPRAASGRWSAAASAGPNT